MADLVFTAHALDQMRARHIPAVAVQHVVEYPDDVLDCDDGCAEYRGVWEARTISVVACGDREPYRVRTVIETTRRLRR
jgi:hypothetical protein